MLSNVRDNLHREKLMPRKTVAEMLLTDNQEELTSCTENRLPISFEIGPAPELIISIDDIKTILGGLISGGFETVFSTAIIAIGRLATKEGQEMQQRAYEDILSAYLSPEEAFEHAVDEEKSAYISALVKEALRFYPPLKLLPARQTYKEFVWHGATISKGLLIYVNAQAANRGERKS